MYFRQTLITFSRMGSSAKVFTIIVNIYLNSTVYVLLYCLMSEAVNRTSRNYNLPGKGTSPCWKSLPELKHSKSTHEIGTLVCKDHNRRTVWPLVGAFNCKKYCEVPLTALVMSCPPWRNTECSVWILLKIRTYWVIITLILAFVKLYQRSKEIATC